MIGFTCEAFLAPVLGDCLRLVSGWGLVLAILGGSGAAVQAAAGRVPVVYSTDLFHPHQDPDDHFDLACLYALGEADVRGIILDQGDEQEVRSGARAVGQLNRLTGREVPAVVGLRDRLKSPTDSGADQPDAFQGGVKLVLKVLKEAVEPVVLIFVGSARDVVAARNRDPELFQRKVRGVYGFIGDAGDPGHREWNVQLDPQAFMGLWQADVPLFWVPCFDGGVWTNRGHASFWRARHGALLEGAPKPLQRYFLYMLQKSTDEPLSFLEGPVAGTEREWLMGHDRNLWCGAVLGMAVGRELRWEGERIAGFKPVEAWVDGQAVVHYGQGAGSRTVQRFEVEDVAAFGRGATGLTAELLAGFPMKARAPVAPKQ